MLTIKNIERAADCVSMQVYIEANRENFFTVLFDKQTGSVKECSRDDADAYIQAVCRDYWDIVKDRSGKEEYVLL
ncbi:hypothetical protein WMO41_15180 [Ventrimonas sp. CLA-AP-H27]|uniref:KTSC domain-containing protein n=1 Tax=Ventrimonas faecis TaxID=3133170 RepID=A0ABV1HQ85_9FIRM